MMMDRKKRVHDVLVLAGAGFGIDAGLPDYAGVHEMANEAAQQHGVEPFMIEHPSFYKSNPKAAWGMKARVMNIFLTKEPHAGYHGLLSALDGRNAFVVTSNIDGHFRKAGLDEQRLYEIHGRLDVLQCVNRSCNSRHPLWPLGPDLPQETDMVLDGAPPTCIYCGDFARPNVCFTDDNSFCPKLRDAQKARFKQWARAAAGRRKPELLVYEVGCGRHKDSIGMTLKDDGTFRVMSKELELPPVFTTDNVTVVRVNPDRGIPGQPWETVVHETGLRYFS